MRVRATSLQCHQCFILIATFIVNQIHFSSLKHWNTKRSKLKTHERDSCKNVICLKNNDSSYDIYAI